MSRKLMVFFFFLTAFACHDILEEDISQDAIILRTPPAAFATQETEIVFWWEFLDGATSYQILITSPDYQNPTTLLLDSTVTKDKLTFTLPVGDYEWCVRGKNSGYETEYACRKLFIVN
jgi:hypothetical protein